MLLLSKNKKLVRFTCPVCKNSHEILIGESNSFTEDKRYPLIEKAVNCPNNQSKVLILHIDLNYKVRRITSFSYTKFPTNDEEGIKKNNFLDKNSKEDISLQLEDIIEDMERHSKMKQREKSDQ